VVKTIKTEKMNKQKLNDYYRIIFIFLMLTGWAIAMYYFGKSISFQDQRLNNLTNQSK
jgi:membrane protein CcdC involved in cytochrome C biogenesis